MSVKIIDISEGRFYFFIYNDSVGVVSKVWTNDDNTLKTAVEVGLYKKQNVKCKSRLGVCE